MPLIMKKHSEKLLSPPLRPDQQRVAYWNDKVNPQEQTAERTRATWRLFEIFSNEQLDMLLEEAGVRPMKNRSFKIQQALIVWYHGNIPNVTVIGELAEKTVETFR
jgi:hypothetical protein